MGHGLHPLNVTNRCRSHLCVPGTSIDMIRRAADSAAEAVCLDLAPATSGADKTRARRTVFAALDGIDWGCRGKRVSVRIGGPGSGDLADDLRAVLAGGGETLDAVVVPGVESAAEAADIAAMLVEAERAAALPNIVSLELQLSAPIAIGAAASIARMGGRLRALHLDRWYDDYAALSYLVLACRAFGLRALEGPYAAVTDIAGLTHAAARAASLGADGAWAVHPSQLDAIADAFAADTAGRGRARALHAA
ncbi:MAG: aldolase/citrate lyase family protein [Pseudomonadota bacterium]